MCHKHTAVDTQYQHNHQQGLYEVARFSALPAESPAPSQHSTVGTQPPPLCLAYPSPLLQVRADKCLIVNTKGGGHAFIGLYLAKELVAKGHEVTIFNDGDQVLTDPTAAYLVPHMLVVICGLACSTVTSQQTPCTKVVVHCS